MNPRHAKILNRLRGGREVSVMELAAGFNVTPMTIRRDLSALEATGRVVRTHGGAILSKPGTIEFTFQKRSEERIGLKRAIAKKAVEFIQPGTAVSLDTGTTTLQVARRIAGIGDVTVLTSSLAIASALYAHDGIDLILLGGAVRKNSPDLTGELTVENLKRFRTHTAILGADALSSDGAFTTDAGVAAVSRAMMRHARRKILVADSGKFDCTAFVKFASWDDIDVLVTDTGVSPGMKRRLKKMVRTVVFATADD